MLQILTLENSHTFHTHTFHTFHEQPLHYLKIRVWCAISWRFVDPVLSSETITAEHYQEILQFIALLEADEYDCWLQQDGATAHMAKSTVQILHDFFSDQIISHVFGPLESSDLFSY